MKLNKFLLLIFLEGFIFSYSTIYVFSLTYSTETKVLSYSSNEINSETPTQVLTPTPSLTPTPTPRPTVTPTPFPSLTPTPTPTPKPVVAPPDMEHWFDEFSAIYKADEEKLKKIANCESHFNPGVWKEPYAGMYQFTEGTWTNYRKMMGKDPNKDLRFGARESIETAAYILSLGNEHIWPACSK